MFLFREHGVTEWSDEYENYVIHMLLPSQSPDFSSTTRLWKILEHALHNHYQNTNEETSWGRVLLIPSGETQTIINQESSISGILHWKYIF